jgi:hypothetical protein
MATNPRRAGPGRSGTVAVGDSSLALRHLGRTIAVGPLSERWQRSFFLCLGIVLAVLSVVKAIEGGTQLWILGAVLAIACVLRGIFRPPTRRPR